MFADDIRRAVEAAPRMKLPEVTALLWRAFGAGQVTEAEAESLSALIEARKLVPTAPASARRAVGTRPRTDASMERRRRWAASGRLPPAIAAQFTLAETAALAVVASEVARRGDCRLCIDHIAALAGVGRSTVKTAIRRGKMLGLLTVEERPQTAWRNLSNVLRITSKEWIAWTRLLRRTSDFGGGVKLATGTNTKVQDTPNSEASRADQRAAERQSRARICGQPGSKQVRFVEKPARRRFA